MDTRLLDVAKTPFANLSFLKLLEDSESLGEEKGWIAKHIAIFNQNTFLGFLPCYKKTHSYGEYVFDHAWANAYHQHGLAYYPKLLCAIPFTPVPLNKLVLLPEYADLADDIIEQLSLAWTELDQTYSSFHLLFMPEQQAKVLEKNNFHRRLNVQFIFKNKDYTSFDNFLADLKSRKRKSLKKERAEIQKANLSIRRYTSSELNHKLMDNFYLCYQQTYLKRSGHTGYLTKAFFDGLLKTMRDKIMLVMAHQNETVIAGALFFYDDRTLYGRYWGALQEVSGLHFECCYYQGIEFTIEKGLKIFNPGTQGEHKILRGFTPSLCFSLHKMQHPAFDDAVRDFTRKEAPHMMAYLDETSALLPFRSDD